MQKYYAHTDSVKLDSKEFDFYVELYLADLVDARIAELERLLREAQYFVSDDFPPAPIETLTIDDVCATPRYFQFWKDLNKALMERGA